MTQLDICNLALLKIGEKPLENFDGTNAPTTLANSLFEPTLNSLLISHNWKFATTEFNLTSNTGEFEIPINILRILSIQNIANYEIVGNIIKCAATEITINAITKQNADNLPDFFITPLSLKLAMEFCLPLSDNTGLYKILGDNFASELKTAKFNDSSNAPSNTNINFPLINERF
jgi:hypothetical protein